MLKDKIGLLAKNNNHKPLERGVKENKHCEVLLSCSDKEIWNCMGIQSQ